MRFNFFSVSELKINTKPHIACGHDSCDCCLSRTCRFIPAAEEAMFEPAYCRLELFGFQLFLVAAIVVFFAFLHEVKLPGQACAHKWLQISFCFPLRDTQWMEPDDLVVEGANNIGWRG